MVECVRPTSKDPEIGAAACAKYEAFCKDKVPDWGAKTGRAGWLPPRGRVQMLRPDRQVDGGSGLKGRRGQGGHLFPLGNTEEELILENFGTAGRGLECDGTFDHTNGVGYVKERKGLYDDAFAKKNTLLLLISEIDAAKNH